MPIYTRNELRENLTYVRVGSDTANLFYGWKAKDLASESGISQADLTALGHLAPELLPTGARYFLGANSPKPGRATKTINSRPSASQKGSVSTFYGTGSIRGMLNLGWKITKRPRSVSLVDNSRYISAVAELSNGLLYAFPMNKDDFATYGAELGLKSKASITTNAERNSLIAGTSFPRPGKAKKQLSNGANFSSFFSTDKLGDVEEAGYTILFGELTDD